MAKKLPFRIQKGDNTLDKIMAHHIDPIRFPLSDKLELIRKRWAEVLTLRFNYYSPQQIVNKLMEDQGISMAQAYLDIKNSEIIYGNVMQADKKGTKAILYEYAHKFYQRAMKAEDLKAQAKALELMAEFGGIRDIEQADYNPEKFENKEITINLSKNLQGKLMDMIGAGVVNFNSLDVTEVDFEEIKPEEDDD
jgi:hypothetical protein